MDALIQAHGVHSYYGSSHVLHGIDFRLGAGETVGLFGRNGMGKTTLLRTLIGHVVPRQGAVHVRGADVTGLPPERIARQGIAYVPEGRGVFPNLSVRENLVMAARPGRNGDRTWSLERVLDTFPILAARLSHRGNQLSGGEQQMLAIGRALLTNPDALLLDEATEGLAPLIAQEIWRVLASLRGTGVATLLVDRSVATVLAHADRGVILVKGEVVADLPATEMRARSDLLHRHLGI
jgi:branched-chain amino acid transport system ATP-binding protein